MNRKNGVVERGDPRQDARQPEASKSVSHKSIAGNRYAHHNAQKLEIDVRVPRQERETQRDRWYACHHDQECRRRCIADMHYKSVARWRRPCRSGVRPGPLPGRGGIGMFLKVDQWKPRGSPRGQRRANLE